MKKIPLRLRYLFAVIALGLTQISACDSKKHAPLPTVSSTVDLSRYLGKWYEVTSLPNRFQAMCVADTLAEYSLASATDKNEIRVVNRCRKADGKIEQADGIARLVEGSNNSKFRVSFFRPFYGNYWILDLDPDYRWVLVGEPGREYGWILSRSPILDKATVDAILNKAAALGYDRTAFKMTPQTAPL